MLTALCMCLLVACSGDDILTDHAMTKGETTETALVTANLTNLTAGGLQAALQTALGENSLKVQKLTLAGEINSDDALYLRTLASLKELDMAGLAFKESSSKDEYGSTVAELHPDATPSDMLRNLEYLTTVTFPTGITGLGENTCYGDTSLIAVTLPPALTEISNYAFNSCFKLASISFPASLKSLGDYALSGCTALKSLELPEGIEYVGNGNVQGCPSLTSIRIPHSFTNIPPSFLSGCNNLVSVELLADIQEIPSSMFAYCTSLKTVTLGANITSIGIQAFYDCTALTDFSQFDQITSIGREAFRNTGFENVVLSANVRSIKQGAFENSQIKSLTVPATVTDIEGSIINYCPNLTSVFWDSTADVYDAQGSNRYCYLYLGDKNTAYGPNWKNVIIEGIAENIELKTPEYWEDQNAYSFFCPRAFTAKKISYTRRYDQTTGIGQSSGWYTLALPFAPTAITHETKGVITPFGDTTEGAKHFWLRELKSDGFADATAIEANKPYIIAMPFNYQYQEEYNLNGTVTFSAENAELKATPDVLPPSEGPEFKLYPVFQFIPYDQVKTNMYTLNVNFTVAGHEQGSVFAYREYDGINPFTAYVVPNTPASRSCFGIDTSSPSTRAASEKNRTGVPMAGDM